MQDHPFSQNKKLKQILHQSICGLGQAVHLLVTGVYGDGIALSPTWHSKSLVSHLGHVDATFLQELHSKHNIF